jgi:hypothetical protein
MSCSLRSRSRSRFVVSIRTHTKSSRVSQTSHAPNAERPSSTRPATMTERREQRSGLLVSPYLTLTQRRNA